MDYEQMSVQELRDACQARGLGTARSRAELIQRLTDHDTSQDAFLAEGEHVMAAATVAKTAESAAPPLPQKTFQQAFPAEPHGPDEETHLAYRQATTQTAAEAGLVPRGDARLAAARDGMWVYEVSVRQAI